MIRRPVVISSLILIAIAAVVLIWTRSAQGLSGISTVETQVSTVTGNIDDAQAVRETILKARRIQLEAEYTFDTSKYASVYINDPRGGKVTAEALAFIQEVRRDPTIQADQVGNLDNNEVAIENLKHHYDSYMTDLRAKQAAGTLTDEELTILNGEMNGWPTPEPTMQSALLAPTQTCYATLSDPSHQADYPIPQSGPQPVPCRPSPTPNLRTMTLVYYYRGPDPATLPPEAFNMDISSIKIQGDTATAVVSKGEVTSQYVLVKVNGQWYIAGAKLLQFTP